jgi:predicted amidohydrolase
MDCRIAIAQINPRLGDLHANIRTHLDSIADARRAGAELVVFPELSLTGYYLKDQVFELGLRRNSDELARFADLSRDISIAVGFVERSPEERYYNSIAFFEDGDLLAVHRKVHLVSYGMFDEARDFAAGEEFRIIESRLGRFGPLLCEDLWHVPSAYIHFLNNADALLVASAPPARGVEAPGPGPSSQRAWDTMSSACAMFFRTWVIYAGRVGWEDGIGFGGGSCVIDPFGVTRARLEGIEPGMLEATLEAGALRRARIETPLRRDEKPWILAEELARHVPLAAMARASEQNESR